MDGAWGFVFHCSYHAAGTMYQVSPMRGLVSRHASISRTIVACGASSSLSDSSMSASTLSSVREKLGISPSSSRVDSVSEESSVSIGLDVRTRFARAAGVVCAECGSAECGAGGEKDMPTDEGLGVSESSASTLKGLSARAHEEDGGFFFSLTTIPP